MQYSEDLSPAAWLVDSDAGPAVADGDGFAVQDGEGAPVVRIAADGGVRVHPAPGLTLRVAHDGDLWLTGGATVIVPHRVLGEPCSPPLPRCSDHDRC